MLINKVDCDVIIHVDKQASSASTCISLSDADDFLTTAYLFCQDRPYSVPASCSAKCCIRNGDNKTIVDCSIGNHGEIIFPIPQDCRIINTRLICEIIISGIDTSGENYRFRTADFIMVVIE